MGSLAHLITRKWVAGLLALFAILGTGAVIGLVGQAESPATGTAALPNGTDSRQAAELRDQLPQAEGSAAVVLYSSDQPLTPDELALVAGARRTPAGSHRRTGRGVRGRNRRNGVRPGHHKDAVETADVVTELRAGRRPTCPRGSPPRSPARRPSRPTSRPSSTAPTSGCSPPRHPSSRCCWSSPTAAPSSGSCR